jgi:hypothetical protein
MSTSTPVQLRVVVYPEGDRWVARCLEVDLCTSASTLDELPAKVRKQLYLQKLLDHRAGRQPFENFKPAPKVYWELFERSRPWTQVSRTSWLRRTITAAFERVVIQPRLSLAAS